MEQPDLATWQLGELTRQPTTLAWRKAGLMYKFGTLVLFTYLSASVKCGAFKTPPSPSPVRYGQA